MRASLGARLAGYPERAHAQMHRARALLPARAAAVLRAAPDLAAPAVEAFHYRDADDMRAAARMARFPPEVGPVTLFFKGVWRNLIFLRAGVGRPCRKGCGRGAFRFVP